MSITNGYYGYSSKCLVLSDHSSKPKDNGFIVIDEYENQNIFTFGKLTFFDNKLQLFFNVSAFLTSNTLL